MKQVYFTLACMLLSTFTFSRSATCNTLLINSPGLSTVLDISDNVNSIVLKKKKGYYKRKFLLKWLKKKNEEEQKKKLIKTLGIVSFTSSLLAVPLFFIGLFTIFALSFIGLSISLIAFILGIVALSKRSKLKDKAGTRRWPALLGIILGMGFLIGIAIAILITLST